MNDRRRVYIPNRSGHDFSAAKRFGELVFMSSGRQNRYRVTKIYRKYANILMDSTAEDYILVTGLNIMNSIASAIMSNLHGRVNWLLYVPHRGEYEVRTIVMSELLNNEEIEDDD